MAEIGEPTKGAWREFGGLPVLDEEGGKRVEEEYNK